MIKAYAVAYIDVAAIGSVANSQNPTGPLGGLGPLPDTHTLDSIENDLNDYQFGLQDRHIVELLDGLSGGKRVAVLEAGTGTGKSTFGPFRLMNPPDRPPGPDGSPPFSPTAHGPIIVTEPRIPATTGVATFVGESLCYGHKDCSKHIGPGFPVGYQKSGEKFWDDACQLIYVTDGSMINWIREGRLARIGTVIVDEAHERSENIDLILALLREQLPRHPHLRVIIASATIDKNFFIEFFGGEEKVHYQYVEAVKGVGFGVPLFPDLEVTSDVIERGLEEEEPIGRFDPWLSTGPDGEDLVRFTEVVAGLKATEEIPDDDWTSSKPSAVVQAVADQVVRLLEGTDPDSGDILAFLPTKDTINTACDLIKRALGSSGAKTFVYPLLSTIDEPTKKKALAPSRRGARKVVISSNLAETSLTVSGVRFVIDSGLICQSEWDPRIAQQSLPTKPHSQSGVRQRWGRVGRDQPGWVFPLYTRRQFAELMGRNTPAGSTRANLEQFLIKLKSAGVDRPGDIVLPGAFSNERYQPDKGGEESGATFTMELQRAERALSANGAVDGDGHLTSFGRELERFSGSPEHAMAVMFADRLACVTEVAMALSLLSNGQLIDRRGLLRFDRDWPPGWRVQATLCHRALAVGCTDDLDLILRIAATWQRQADPSTWARRWWVNEDALLNAVNDTADLVGNLSSAMKAETARPVNLQLISRARAVLSRSLASITYAPVGDGAWRLEMDPEGSIVELGRNQLVPVTGRVMALSRFRPPTRPGTDAPNPVIQGLIEVTPWARRLPGDDSDPDPMELLVRAASMLDRQLDQTAGECDRVRSQFPVGCVVSVRKDALVRVCESPDPGELPQDLDEEDDDGTHPGATGSARRQKGVGSADEEASSFDVGRQAPAGSDRPDEEQAVDLIDVRSLEENDSPTVSREHSETPQSAVDRSDEDGALLEPIVLPILWVDKLDSDSESFARVLGYEMGANGVSVKLTPHGGSEAHNISVPDLKFGSEVKLLAKGEVKDHISRYRVFEIEGGGEFLESEMTGAFDRFNREWIFDLPEGSTWKGIVVPGFGSKDPLAISLLPNLFGQFSKLKHSSGRMDGDRWYRGSVIGIEDLALSAEEEPDEDNLEIPASSADRRVTVELEMPGNKSAAPFRFVLQETQLSNLGVIEPGMDVEVRVGSLRAKLQTDLWSEDLLDQLGDEVEKSASGQGLVSGGNGPLTVRARKALVKALPNTSRSERMIWKFWSEVTIQAPEGIQA